MRCTFAAFAAAAVSAQLTAVVMDATPSNRLAKPFLNFNIDTGSVYNGFDFKDPVLINLVYALNNGDVIVRIGGTAADYAFYEPTSTNPNGGGGKTLISDALLDDIAFFSMSTHATILWDFNGLAFRPLNADGTGGPWDPTGNATALLHYLDTKYGGNGGWSWSLGNEPEAWKLKVNATQLGHDVQTLQATLKNYKMGNDVYGAAFEGLSLDPVSAFLNATRGGVSGVTVHNYPLGRNCNVPAYLNRTYIDKLGESLSELVALKHK